METRETPFEELKRYVRFDDDDARALRRAPPARRAALRAHRARVLRAHPRARGRPRRLHGRGADRAAPAVDGPLDGPHALRHVRRRVLRGDPRRSAASTSGSASRSATCSRRWRSSASRSRRSRQETLGVNAGPTRFALSRLLDLELADHARELPRRPRRAVATSRRARGRDRYGRDLARALHLYEAPSSVAEPRSSGVDAKGTIRLFNREATHGHRPRARGRVSGMPFIEHARPARGSSARTTVRCSSAPSGPLRQHIAEDGVHHDARGQGPRRALALLAHPPTARRRRRPLRRRRGHDRRRAPPRGSSHQNEKLAALGTLAAGLAHEIRNPLNGAQLHVTFLERALEQEAPRAGACSRPRTSSPTRSSGSRARLASSSISRARTPLVKKRVAVQCALRAASSSSRPRRPPATGITGRRPDMPPQELVHRWPTPSKLQQVLLNLVQNAIEALEPAGTGHVMLRARRHPRHVLLEIEDDGPGLPSPDAPVFDAFFSTKPAGTGLGPRDHPPHRHRPRRNDGRGEPPRANMRSASRSRSASDSAETSTERAHERHPHPGRRRRSRAREAASRSCCASRATPSTRAEGRQGRSRSSPPTTRRRSWSPT